MQLFFNKNFTVVRQIPDHTDLTTYYVRAVIRNAFTDEIIATLDLDSKGSQRYKKDWIVPRHSSGEPYYISIVTSVYTDSGYTTKSASYGDDENTYQVIDFSTVKSGGVGNGGGSLSRRDIKDVIQDEIEKIMDKMDSNHKMMMESNMDGMDDAEDPIDFSPVMKAIKAVGDKIKPVVIPKVDLKPVLKAIDSLKSAIESVEIPENDISPILKKIDALDVNNKKDKDELKSAIEEYYKNFGDTFEDRVRKVLDNLKIVTSSVTFVDEKGLPALHKIQGKDLSKMGEEKKSIDINQLSS